MTYDFRRLSGVDFEHLVHDLLQVDWKTQLEIFAGGRDGGVDLRRRDGNGLLVVQCKNYERSGYPRLKSQLQSEELPKIERLAPDRYVLVTSVDLTVGQKDELVSLLSPWVRVGTDVIGKTELTALLAVHDLVVRRHHKLWLTSVAVMQQMLHGAEHVQAATEVERIQRKLDVYVETNALARAVQVLKDHHVLIVSGEPGIGKSTLADMILLDHIANGYRPAVIRGSLNEGRRLGASGGPTIFYFDDFLGQTYLGDRPDFLGKREDADLISFVEWVRSRDDLRFVLTTREHILTEALMRSERLREAGLGDERCIITIADLSRAQRARILYNHLEFSDLPAAYKVEMLRDEFYLEVIDFERFNPRVVQWLSSHSRLKTVPVTDYQQHVRALMENPLEIWRHAYQHEISQASRDVLIAVYSLGFRAYVDDLERCFDLLHPASLKRLNLRSTVSAYRSAMKELDGSFIRIDAEGVVTFLNPSIADFAADVLKDDGPLAIDVISSAVRFRQVSMLIEGADPGGPLQPLVQRFVAAGAVVAAAAARTLDAPYLRWIKRNDGMVGHYVDLSPTSRAEWLVARASQFPLLGAIADGSLDALTENVARGQQPLSELQGVLSSVWKRRAEGSHGAATKLLAAVGAALDGAYAADWYAMLELREEIGASFDIEFPHAMATYASFLDNDLTEERLACDSAASANDLRYYLDKLRHRHGSDVGYDIDQLDERISELEAEEGRHAPDEPSEEFFAPNLGKPEATSDDEIRSMFRGLVG